MDIRFEKVDFTYQPNTPFEQRALFDINLTIQENSYTALVGHTGSGKSTLLQHLNALIKPTSGSVHIGDRKIMPDTNNKNLKPIRKKVGIVFQFPEAQLFEETVAKDIAFGPKNFGVSEEEARELAQETLAQVGLDASYLERSPFELSGGQMRRVAIAGVLAMKPEVLVLDEPTAGLDPISTRAIVDIIKGLNKRGVKIVISSHDMNLIYEICDYVYVLNQGHLINEGTREEVFVNEEKIDEAGLELPWLVKLHKHMGLPLFTNEEDLYSYWNHREQKTV